MSTQEKNQILPLSLSQREVWLDQIAWPNSAHLNIGGCLDLTGYIDVSLMQNALQLLIDESMSLRSFLLHHGEQVVLERYSQDFEYIDFTSKIDSVGEARSWQQEWMKIPFDVFNSPPWRFALIKTEHEKHLIVIQFHHSIMDGWGTLQLIQRWGELYSQLANSAPCSPSPVDYKNFIVSSNEFLVTGSEKEKTFWLQEFSEIPEALFEKRYDTGREVTLPEAHLITHSIKKQNYAQVVDTAAYYRTTSYHWFIAIFVVYFARTEKKKKITIGVPNLNRTGKRFKSTLGMFVNVLPLTLDYDPLQPFAELVKLVSTKLRNIYRNSRLPVSEMVKQLEHKSASRESIFDIIFSFEKQDYDCQFGKARITRSHQTFSTYARYPLGITLCEFHEEQDIELIIEGNSRFFTHKETELIAKRIESIMSQTAEQPDVIGGKMQLLSSSEKSLILHKLHEGVVHHSHFTCYVDQFSSQVLNNPNNIALLNANGEFSYKQLENVSNYLASQLVKNGIKERMKIVIFIPRSAEMLVSLIAVSKLNCIFIPVDTELPANRIQYILEHSKADFCLRTSGKDFAFNIPSFEFKFETLLEQAYPVSEDYQNVKCLNSDIAYILYTSGSTGQPKGVPITHDVLSKKLNFISKSWKITQSDRAGQLIQSHFDPSLIEMLVPLIQGASLAIPPARKLLANEMVDFAEKYQVTFMAFVPMTLSAFLVGMDRGCNIRLRVACCGGEILAKSLAQDFIKKTGARLFNVYGPTESCIYSTSYEVLPNTKFLQLPIGYPTDDCKVYVLDEDMSISPLGVKGEIYIGGNSIAKGYIGNVNADKFIDNPYVNGERLYKTGDQGWLSEDGLLHFTGRLDRQVKLRGYRIELEEVEASLLSIDGVELAAVALRKVSSADVLCAWIKKSKPLTEHELRGELAKLLPDYMLPSKFSFLDRIPSTTNGKIDYRALLMVPSKVLTMESRVADGPIEHSLLSIWQDVLNNPVILTNDNFFLLGGDSLAAIIMLTRLEAELNVKLPLSSFVANPTIKLLAKVIETERNRSEILVGLGKQHTNKRLYIAASGHGDLLRFTALSEALSGVCDVFMLQPPLNRTAIDFESLAELYAEIIEQNTANQVFMAGFSVGGVTALETSKLLTKRGVQVEELFLIDTILFKLPPGGMWIWKLFSWLSKRIRFDKYNGRASTILNDSGLYSQVRAMDKYKPEKYDGTVTLIKTSILTYLDRLLFAKWRNVCTNKLTEKEIQGKHGTIFNPGRVDQLANQIAQRIDRETLRKSNNVVALGALKRN